MKGGSTVKFGDGLLIDEHVIYKKEDQFVGFLFFKKSKKKNDTSFHKIQFPFHWCRATEYKQKQDNACT